MTSASVYLASNFELRPSNFLCVPSVHNPHDARIHRRLGGQKRKRRFPAADEEDVLTDTGADGVGGDERAAAWCAIGCHRLQDQQLVRDEILILDGGHDVPDDEGDLHGGLTSGRRGAALDVHMIDHADDRGVDVTILQPKGHAR